MFYGLHLKLWFYMSYSINPMARVFLKVFFEVDLGLWWRVLTGKGRGGYNICLNAALSSCHDGLASIYSDSREFAMLERALKRKDTLPSSTHKSCWIPETDVSTCSSCYSHNTLKDTRTSPLTDGCLDRNQATASLDAWGPCVSVLLRVRCEY